MDIKFTMMSTLPNCYFLIYLLIKCVNSQNIIETLNQEAYDKSDFYRADLSSNYIVFENTTNCTQEVENLSRKISSFIVCAIHNSRPISICRSCVRQMNDTQEVYNVLKQKPELEICRQMFFESDKLSIVETLFNDVNSLWINSHCDSCYMDGNSGTNYTFFSQETQRFFNALEEFNNCISLMNKTDVNNNTCVKCISVYSTLNKVYQAIVEEGENADGACMDVVDAMNITRHLWYNKYKCVHFDTSIGIPNIVTALLIGSMPFFFYLISRNIAIIEDIKLVQPKRKNSRYSTNQQ